MHRSCIFISRLAGVAALAVLTLAGCRSRQPTDNPDVAAGYRDNKYQEGIVTGRHREDHDDQGASISPKTLRNIEDAIISVYEKDFERCLEAQMDEHETRFMRSVFTVEFRIETTGNAGNAKILSIQTRKQDAKGTDLGEVSSAEMKACISRSIDEWEFDPPPEALYVHTYRGQVGEAF